METMQFALQLLQIISHRMKIFNKITISMYFPFCKNLMQLFYRVRLGWSIFMRSFSRSLFTFFLLNS